MAGLQPPQKNKRKALGSLDEDMRPKKDVRDQIGRTRNAPIIIDTSSPPRQALPPFDGWTGHPQIHFLPTPPIQESSVMTPTGATRALANVIPERPKDRKAEGYKDKIRLWFEHVERLIERKTVFVVKQKLGEGGQGRAVLVENKKDDGGPKIAVAKMFAKECDAVAEIQMLKHDVGQHANLVKMYPWTSRNESPIRGINILVLEYCDIGSVSDYRDQLVQGKKPVDETLIWHITISLAKALAYLHTGCSGNSREPYAIVHRDIKPENILLKSDTSQSCNIAVKLSDFGLAKKLTHDGRMLNDLYSSAGTHDWQPAEQVMAPHYAGPEQDIWSLGAVVHYLALGEPPIDWMRANRELEEKSQAWKASIPRRVTRISGRPDLRKRLGHQKHYTGDGHQPWANKYSIRLNRWMMRMLKMDPNERATAVELAKSMEKDFARR